jgi:tetratricopeptide (TPR) repeat protein
MTRGIVAVVLLASAMGCAPKVPPAAPGAPHYPEFVSPIGAAGTTDAGLVDQQWAWQQLQAGDLAAAERVYTRVLKQAPGDPAALAGLGYVALARQDASKALARFDDALHHKADLAAALVGRAQALLQLNRVPEAVASFEAAQKADSRLDLAARIETLRFRAVDASVARARALAASGKLDDARAAYEQALTASPDSALLHRELAVVERRALRDADADAHLERALELDPSDRASHLLLAESREKAGDLEGAANSFEAAQRIESTPDIDARLASLRERQELARMPEAYRAIAQRESIDRADLAALLGVRLGPLLRVATPRPTPLVTDVRGSWALPWIMTALRAGVMDPYANHTFQPGARMHRAELALIVSRVLDVIQTQDPKRAQKWQKDWPPIPDVPPAHPAYAAIGEAVAADVLKRTSTATFEPTRFVSGAEAIDAVNRLEQLAGPLVHREHR